VLNAPTYYTTLAPNDALPDPKFYNQCKTWKIKVAFKNSHTTRGCQKKRFAPNTRDPLCAKDTWSVLSEMVAFKDPLALDTGYHSSLGSSFVIEIQANAMLEQ